MSRPVPRFVCRAAPSRATPAEMRPGSERLPLRFWDADGRLNCDAVCRLMDSADATVEGRIYKVSGTADADAIGAHTVFMGTSLLAVDLGRLRIADVPVNEAFVRRLRGAMARDRRTHVAIRNRVWREAARLLGNDTPSSMDVVRAALRSTGNVILIDVDVEGRIEGDPVEREIVDVVVALRDAGLSIRAIAAELAARGISRPEPQTHH